MNLMGVKGFLASSVTKDESKPPLTSLFSMYYL